METPQMDQWHAWMNPVVLNFPIREGANVEGEYEGFIHELRHNLAHHPELENNIARYGEWLRRGHPLLPVLLAPQPARWIHINLIVQDEVGVEETRTTIAVRDDNVYFIGFKNLHGQWYEFGKKGRNAPFIPGSTFLGCDVSYRGLVGDSANLVQLSLTKYDAIRAVRTLSEYQQTGPANGETRRHLARLCVLICECARMIPHHDNVVFHWNRNDQTGITPEQAENINKWSNMSRELLSDPHPEENRYLDIVHLLHNTPERIFRQQDQQGKVAGGGGSSQQGPGSSNPPRPETSSGGSGGRAQEQPVQTGDKSVRTKPLVEVYSVEAEFGDGIDSIVVFDGKRGQIIYKHGTRSQGSRHGNFLPLTGPNKAISADGSFTIKVYGINSGTDASDESSKSVSGEMLWDCYADDVVYDKSLTRDIMSSSTGQHTLGRVRYVVLSDAVEATVEVNLLLPAGITHVHGEISACCVPLQYRKLVPVLFSREPDEKVELVPSRGADSMVPLELARSVIAVPVLSRYSHMFILVELHVAHPNGKGDVHLEGSISFYLDKHTGEIRIDQEGDIFVPVGWTAGSDPKGSGTSHGSSQGAASSPSRQGTEETSEQQVKVQVNISSPGFHLTPLKPYSDWRRGMYY